MIDKNNEIYLQNIINKLMEENKFLKNDNRILSCRDNILDKKYFIIVKTKNILQGTLYFYNMVEEFFLYQISKNSELLSIDNSYEIKYYLNKENYNIFKVINYENIIEELNNINRDFKISHEDIEYTLEDFYTVLDYIQERSIYLGLYK